jgi:uncharacterized protein DUF3738
MEHLGTVLATGDRLPIPSERNAGVSEALELPYANEFEMIQMEGSHRMTRPNVWLVLVSMTSAGWGQTPATPAQKFEVASIRLHTGPVQRVGGAPSGPKLVMEAMSLRNLVGYAYDLKDYQIAGTTGWMETDRYDISAKAEGDIQRPIAEFRQMMQSLLAERFHVRRK